MRSDILIFLFLNQNICCWYSKKSSQWDGSFEHPKHMFNWWVRKYLQFYSENVCLSKPVYSNTIRVSNSLDPDQARFFGRLDLGSVVMSEGMVLGHFGHGHFGLGRFGLEISATDVSAAENVEGGRFSHNHKFGVWDVCMHKCVMHFIIFWNQICMWILTVDSKMHDNKSMLFFIERGKLWYI